MDASIGARERETKEKRWREKSSGNAYLSESRSSVVPSSSNGIGK